MNSRHKPHCHISTLLCFLIAGSVPLDAQTAAPPSHEQVVTLPQFQVEAASADPFKADAASSAARTAAAIIDTPTTINVITPALIEDINPDKLIDVSNYYAGVSPGRAPITNDRQTFRGFESFGLTVDNFSEIMLPYMYSQFADFIPAYLDHAELIMGPDTILSPTGTPGGTLAAVTKSPQFDRGTDVSLELGNYNAQKFTVDTTGPIGDGRHMAFQVIGMYQDTKTYIPGTYTVQAGAVEFTYKFSDSAKLDVKYFLSNQRLGGVNASEGSSGEEVYTADTVGGEMLSKSPQPGFRYNGWNGDASWASYTVKSNTLETVFTSALGSHINMRLGGQLYYSDLPVAERSIPIPSFTEKWDPATGQEISVTPINPAAIPEEANLFHVYSRQIQFQNDFAGSFKAGPVTLTPVFGWAYQNGYVDFWETGDKNVPAANLADVTYDPPKPAYSAFNLVQSNIPEIGWTFQGYGYLRASFFNDHLFLTGGVARTWAHVNDYSLPYVISGSQINAGTAGAMVDKTFSNTQNPLAPSVQPWHDTYVAGALYKLLPNLSVYYNYSTAVALASAAPLWQYGVQNEFGVKSNFFADRISVSADHFEITQNNVSYQNPAINQGAPAGTPLNIYLNEASHGEELNVAGGITPNLSVIASYTSMKLRDAFGRRLRNVPDNMANLLLDYHFNLPDGEAVRASKNSDVWLGVVHEGDFAGENVSGFTSLGVPEQPGYYIPAFTVLNAGGGYRWREYKINLNVNNVLNEKFWWNAYSRSSLSPYPGLGWSITIKRHF